MSERRRANRDDPGEPATGRDRRARDRGGRPVPGGERATMGAATLRWAVWLLYLEALAVAVVTGLLLYAAATQKAVSASAAVTIVLFMAGLSALLGLLGWLLSRRKGGARAPAIVLELLFLPIGYYVVEGGVAWLGVPLMVLGLACAALLLAPPTRQVLDIR